MLTVPDQNTHMNSNFLLGKTSNLFREGLQSNISNKVKVSVWSRSLILVAVHIFNKKE